MTFAFNPDLEAGEYTFNLGHTFSWKCATTWQALRSFSQASLSVTISQFPVVCKVKGT